MEEHENRRVSVTLDAETLEKIKLYQEMVKAQDLRIGKESKPITVSKVLKKSLPFFLEASFKDEELCCSGLYQELTKKFKEYTKEITQIEQLFALEGAVLPRENLIGLLFKRGVEVVLAEHKNKISLMLNDDETFDKE